MVKLLNHLYYSLYYWIYSPWTWFDKKDMLKGVGEYKATTNSNALYIMIVALYLYALFIYLIKIMGLSCFVERPFRFYGVLFILCYAFGNAVCFYCSFRDNRHLKYFKKFRKQDDLTRFWWHVLSLIEIVILGVIWIVILNN